LFDEYSRRLFWTKVHVLPSWQLRKTPKAEDGVPTLERHIPPEEESYHEGRKKSHTRKSYTLVF